MYAPFAHCDGGNLAAQSDRTIIGFFNFQDNFYLAIDGDSRIHVSETNLLCSINFRTPIAATSFIQKNKDFGSLQDAQNISNGEVEWMSHLAVIYRPRRLLKDRRSAWSNASNRFIDGLVAHRDNSLSFSEGLRVLGRRTTVRELCSLLTVDPISEKTQIVNNWLRRP